MKRLVLIAALIASPAFADGPSEPWIEKDPTKPVCIKQFLFFKWRGDCNAYSVSNSDGRDSDVPVVRVEHHGDERDPHKPDSRRDVKDDNSDANGKGGNKHNRKDKDKHSQEIAERKKGVD